ncbi:MAG: terminase family protein [Clostridia bacterium]|nr:terminase family protein [Clostridia bacterium]
MPELSPMQRAYRDNATHRWNVKTGATRSGKTWLDVAYVIPARILAVKGKPGLSVLLGNTRGTLTRNVIEPMQEIFGANRVGSIRSDNTALMFGERVHCLGADNKKHVDRLRGTSIKYCYGDEVATWNPDVFDMLKSRLDKPYSVFDGTCNPEGPGHWFKRFLDGPADIYQQHYTLEDNPFLPEAFVAALKQEYAGSVLYQRYILGLWVAAEGAVYGPWNDGESRFLKTVDRKDIARAVTGVDFGGNGSATAFVCVGILKGFRGIAILREYYRKGIVTPAQQEDAFVDFARGCKRDFGAVEVRCDSAEQTLIAGFRSAAVRAGLAVDIRNAVKGEIMDRVHFTLRLMGRGEFWVDPSCAHVREALGSAVYDSRAATDVRLDNGSTNIDSLDAMEYAFEPYMDAIIAMSGVGK